MISWVGVLIEHVLHCIVAKSMSSRSPESRSHTHVDTVLRVDDKLLTSCIGCITFGILVLVYCGGTSTSEEAGIFYVTEHEAILADPTISIGGKSDLLVTLISVCFALAPGTLGSFR